MYDPEIAKKVTEDGQRYLKQIIHNMDQSITDQSISVNELKKLYGINIPIDSQYQYYLGQLVKAGLMKSDKLSTILAGLQVFCSEFTDPHRKKMSLMDNLINYLKGTEAFARMQSYDTQKTEKITSLDLTDQMSDGHTSRS